MFDKKTSIIFIITLSLFLTGVTAISAADINDTTMDVVTNDAGVSTQAQDTSDTSVNDDNQIINEKQSIKINKINKEEKTIKRVSYILVNPNNFATTFTDGGSYSNKVYQFSGSFNNLGLYTLNLNNVVFRSNVNNPAIFTGTSFTLQGTNYNVTGFTFDNCASSADNAITVIDSHYANIKLNDITCNKLSGDVHGISVFRSDYINVTNNSVDITGCPQSMGWNNASGVYSGAVAVSGIVVGNAPYVNVTNNTITVQNNSVGLSGYTTNEGLTIKNPNTQHVMAINNTINVTGAQYNYGTTISDSASNILIHNNTFNMTGAIYNCGIQFDNSGSSEITDNHIYCVSNGESEETYTDAMAYGIINTCWYKPNNQYVDIKNNYINLTANVNYGIELYLTGYSEVQNNTIRCAGVKSMGIGASQVDHTNIIENNIHAKGTDDSVNNIVEVITPNNYGIYTDDCTTTKVNDNVICEHNTGGLTDVYAIYSPTAITEINNNQVCVCNPQGKKTLSDSISASGTPQSGNTLYTCPICDGTCTTQSASLQTTPSTFNNMKSSAKKDSQTIIINADNFNDYVTDGVLNDNVNDGDTLDFQGIFYGARFALNINKPVNIISSTNDAYICLDGANNDFFGVDVGDSYTVSRNGSGTNISGIYFNNTQVFVKNAENVTLDNITVINENIQLGSGVGVTSIRDNSSNVKVLNSYFRTKDNNGHSTLVCAWANNVLVENCTIETEGMVGNMFYTTTYNVEGVEVAAPYANNNITFRNNHINGLKADVAAICYAISLEGKGITIENNLIEYTGNCIMPQWGYGNVSDVTVKNNTIPYGTCQIGYRNSIVTDNTINFSTLERATVTNNKFGSVNIFSNVNFTDNIVGTINGINQRENISIVNNFIDTLNISDNSKNYYVANNTIYSPESYAVNIKRGSENITLENNFIASKDKNSTEAINNQTQYTSINNTGLVIYRFTNEDIVSTHNYNGSENVYIYLEIFDVFDEMVYQVEIGGFEENSVVYADFEFSYDTDLPLWPMVLFDNQPSIIIFNSSNLAQLSLLPGTPKYQKTTLITDSYLPNTLLSLDFQSDVPIACKISDTIFGYKDESNDNFNANHSVYNVSFMQEESINPPVEDNINTSIVVDVVNTVGVGEDVAINVSVLANGTALESGKIVLFDKYSKYGEFDIIDGVATITTSFDEEGNYSFIAYYVGEGNYVDSNAKFNLTVKELKTVLNIGPVNLTGGKLTLLRANITNTIGDNITGGKLTFKINGKTVKDANGKVIYAKVVDGLAQVEYIVPESLIGKEVNITAVYLGTGKYNKETTSLTVNVTAPEATLTVTPIAEDVPIGSNITLKAKVAVGTQPITVGKIAFKINGKLVKDDKGKVIYAKVDSNGEVSVDYNIGNLKANIYTIEAVLISQCYDKISSNTTMNVVKV